MTSVAAKPIIQPGALDFSARYRVEGWGGVAFYARRYASTDQYEGDLLLCADDDCDHALSALCWAEGDTSEIVDYERVVMVMVGDNRERLIEVDELTVLDEHDYCTECGQIGCAVSRSSES